MLSSVALPWKIIAIAFLLSSTASHHSSCICNAFSPAPSLARSVKIARSGRLISASSSSLNRFAPSHLATVRLLSSRVPFAEQDTDSAVSVSIPRWNLWKRLRNSRIDRDRSGGRSVNVRDRRSHWIKAAAAFCTFLFLRPLTAVASGGMGGPPRTTPVPPMERYVRESTYCIMHSQQTMDINEDCGSQILQSDPYIRIIVDTDTPSTLLLTYFPTYVPVLT